MTDAELHELVRSIRTLLDQVLRELDRRQRPSVTVEDGPPEPPATFGSG